MAEKDWPGFGWDGFIGRYDTGFWRPHRDLYGVEDKLGYGPYLSDDELLEIGHLIADPNPGGRIFHITNLPWEIKNFEIGKKYWNKDQWDVFERLISYKNTYPSKFETEGFQGSPLCVIRAKDADIFLHLDIELEIHGNLISHDFLELKNSKVIGSVECLNGGRLEFVQITGDFSGTGDLFLSIDVDGSVHVDGGDFCQYTVTCDTINAEKLLLRGKFRQFMAIMCELDISLKNCEFDNLEIIDCSRVYFL